jgi:hypothetical protein
MNWTRALIAGLAAGFVTNLADFVMHGVLLAGTYESHDVFTKEAANPVWFLVISFCIGIAAAILFAKSRDSWAPGWKGGLTFGFFLGLTAFFANFYDPLVLEGFPYHLAWCWGGANLIDGLLGGMVLGAIYPKA